jgi:hypothetical protein
MCVLKALFYLFKLIILCIFPGILVVIHVRTPRYISHIQPSAEIKDTTVNFFFSSLPTLTVRFFSLPAFCFIQNDL